MQQGSVVAGPQLGHSIHVELHGLDPHNWYYFRFHAGAEVSPVGRTRTAPAMDAMPKKMNLPLPRVSILKSVISMDIPTCRRRT